MAWDIGVAQRDAWDIGVTQNNPPAPPSGRNRAMVCSGWLLPFLPYFLFLVT